MSSARTKHHMMRGNDVSAAEVGESSTFLFTSESVGEGHPGKICWFIVVFRFTGIHAHLHSIILQYFCM